MYDYIKGLLEDKRATDKGYFITVDNNGIGYKCEIPSTDYSQLPEKNSTVKIYTGYGTGYQAGDIHDISVKNVTARMSKYAVQISAEVENITLENIVQNNPQGKLTNE